MTAIELKSVSKRVGHGRRAVQALRGVSLSVERGELLLVEGPSGAGKTTLISVAAGLLGADEGEVHLAGHALHRATVAARRRIRACSIGFVFQRARLLERLTVLQNVVLQARLAGIAPEEGRREALRLLEALGIGELAGRLPRSLSGGEEHRAALARALVHRPAVVFADEPTGNLDAASGQAVAGALTALARDNGAAVVIVTHDLRLRAMTRRRLWMADGQLSIQENP